MYILRIDFPQIYVYNNNSSRRIADPRKRWFQPNSSRAFRSYDHYNMVDKLLRGVSMYINLLKKYAQNIDFSEVQPAATEQEVLEAEKS